MEMFTRRELIELSEKAHMLANHQTTSILWVALLIDLAKTASCLDAFLARTTTISGEG